MAAVAFGEGWLPRSSWLEAIPPPGRNLIPGRTAQRTVTHLLTNAYHEISLKAKLPYKKTMRKHILIFDFFAVPMSLKSKIEM